MDDSIRMESDTSDSSEEQDLLMELGDEASPQEQHIDQESLTDNSEKEEISKKDSVVVVEKKDRRRKIPQKESKKTRVRCVRSGVHSALIRILKGQKIPKKKRSADEIAAYRIKQKPGLNIEVSVVKHPLSGKREERVLVSSGQDDTKTILLKKEEMKTCVKALS